MLNIFIMKIKNYLTKEKKTKDKYNFIKSKDMKECEEQETYSSVEKFKKFTPPSSRKYYY